MKFLVDANLPKLLAVRMRELGYDSFHVKEVGLQESKDTEIWSHAFENGQAIITKDKDLRRCYAMPKWRRNSNM